MDCKHSLARWTGQGCLYSDYWFCKSCGGSGRIDDSNFGFGHALPQQDGQISNPHASPGRRLCISTRQRLSELNRLGVVYAGLISVEIVEEANSEPDQILQSVLFPVETCSRPWNPRGTDTKDANCLSGVVQRRVSSTGQDAKTLAFEFHK